MGGRNGPTKRRWSLSAQHQKIMRQRKRGMNVPRLRFFFPLLLILVEPNSWEGLVAKGVLSFLTMRGSHSHWILFQ